MIDVIERIRGLMASRGWTAYELSNQTGISTGTIYGWINDGIIPTLQSIISVCEACGITLEQFFCEGSYKYTAEENEILNEWCALSDLEKRSVTNLMETFKILKNNK